MSKIIMIVDFFDEKYPQTEQDFHLSTRQATFVELLALQIQSHIKEIGASKVAIVASSYVSCIHAADIIADKVIKGSTQSGKKYTTYPEPSTLQSDVDSYSSNLKKIIEDYVTNNDVTVVIPNQRLVKLLVVNEYLSGLYKLAYTRVKIGLCTVVDLTASVDTNPNFIHWYPSGNVDFKDYIYEKLGTELDLVSKQILLILTGWGLVRQKAVFLENNGHDADRIALDAAISRCLEGDTFNRIYGEESHGYDFLFS